MHSSTGREGDGHPGLYADEPEGLGRGKMPVSMGYEEFRKSYLKAAETLDNSGKSGIVVADNNTTAQAPSVSRMLMRFILVEARSQLIGQATTT